MNADTRNEHAALAPGQQLRLSSARIAEHLVALEFERRPDLAQRYGAVAREKSLQDAGYHLAYLADAMDADSDALFNDYVGWAKIVLARRGVSGDDLAHHLQCLLQVLQEHLPAAVAMPASAKVSAALQALPTMPDEVDSFLDPARPLSPLAHQYLHALLRGERLWASRLVLDAVEGGTPVRQVYLEVFQPVQYEIGRLWQLNRISVSQEHYCTAATQLVMSQLYSRIFEGPRNGYTMVATCVSGDLHEIGARMVSDFFEMAGWDSFYVGANAPHDSVVKTVAERKAQLLAISATIGYHVHEVERLIGAVRADPGCDGVVILVGGYPFKLDPDLWRKVGADASAPDADTAIERGLQLVRERRSRA